jgi:alginate O-acetyltransferase complex protein AlgI
MLFHSFTFAALLVPTLAIYWLSRSQTVRLSVLFVASMIFYAFHHWPSVFLLLVTIAVNYTAARWQERLRSRRLLAVAVLFDLSLLFWFKYAAFAANELRRAASILGVSLPLPALSSWLPLGISFFTFQVVAYQVDVYRGTVSAERSLLVFAVFKGFFAQLIAGPIVRAKDMLPRLRERVVFDPSRFHHGLFLFAAGLFLKIGVADVLRQFADEAFKSPGDLATTDAWLNLYAFAFQLFADFWGYSTMARGLGELFGLELPINFDLPYLTTSLQSFWRHWHITLSNWFRDYVYIPLGGNRTKQTRNLLLTMTAAGVWHGAGWNFVLWGFVHGLWLAAETAWRRRVPKSGSADPSTGKTRRTVGTVVKAFLVFHGVCLLWVLFRAPSTSVAWTYCSRLLLPPYTGHTEVPETLAIWLAGFAVLQAPLSRLMERRQFFARPAWVQAGLTWLLLLVALAYSGQRYDFVYFAF